MLKKEEKIVGFNDIEFHSKPFPYFKLSKFFDDKFSKIILNWLQKDAPWKLVETDFYEQYEFDFQDSTPSSELFFLYENDFLGFLVRQMENIFSVKLNKEVSLTGHKLVSGQTIRIHNDFIPGQETHRLLIQLNQGWNDENGGFLMFFNSSNPNDINRIIRPIHNSSVGFEISSNSNHAVSTIHKGERYTLVYTFYAK